MKIRKNTAFLTCTAILLFLILSLRVPVPITAAASGYEGVTVRVGYYENEVFQEGAREGAAMESHLRRWRQA